MTRTLTILLALAPAGVAHAHDVTLKPLGEARLRYEQVDQDGLAAAADALTLRVRAGVEAKAGRSSALVEGQGNLAIIDDYFDGLHGAATRPLVADLESIALTRAQLRYASPAFAVTAGRQRIGFDDEHFIGSVGFRQNGRTFDAACAEITQAEGVRADLAYAWNVRTIGGIDGAARSYGDEIDLLASAKPGKVTGSVRYAPYSADKFATDTDKYWLQMDWML